MINPNQEETLRLWELYNCLKLIELGTKAAGQEQKADLPGIKEKIGEIALTKKYFVDRVGNTFFYNVLDNSETDVAYFPGIFLGLPYNIVICGYSQSSREIAAKLDYFYTRSRVVENYRKALELFSKMVQIPVPEKKCKREKSVVNEASIQYQIQEILERSEVKDAISELIQNYIARYEKPLKFLEKIKKDILVMGTAYYHFIVTQHESSTQDEFDREVMRLNKLMRSAEEKLGKEKVEEYLMNCSNIEELEQLLKI